MALDEPALPLEIEIFPRLLTGAVVKSDAVARASYLQRQFDLPLDILTRAAASSDAFDALVSALRMDQRLASISMLSAEPDY